jgi:hypothetical protein
MEMQLRSCLSMCEMGFIVIDKAENRINLKETRSESLHTTVFASAFKARCSKNSCKTKARQILVNYETKIIVML